MALQRVAVALRDGWAFVQAEGNLYLVRPPYRRPFLVDEHVLARAIADQGFVAEKRDFSDWASLLAELRQQFIAERKALGKRAADREEVFGILEYAPKAILLGYVNRIETELIPGREWEPALELLTRLLRLASVQADAALHDRTLALLDRCFVGVKSERQAPLESEQTLQRDFPRVAKRYGLEGLQSCSEAIRARRTVFPLPAAA
jgi:hypothetical protein